MWVGVSLRHSASRGLRGGCPGLRTLLNCGRHAVVATSKKNACVSLVFSFLYKVVQVSQATGALEGCRSS